VKRLKGAIKKSGINEFNVAISGKCTKRKRKEKRERSLTVVPWFLTSRWYIVSALDPKSRKKHQKLGSQPDHTPLSMCRPQPLHDVASQFPRRRIGSPSSTIPTRCAVHSPSRANQTVFSGGLSTQFSASSKNPSSGFGL
jgi:hypothetical protein